MRNVALGKGDGLSFDKTNSLHLRKLCARFLLNWASGYKEEILNILKIDKETNKQTASGDQKSSSKISAQVSLKRQD